VLPQLEMNHDGFVAELRDVRLVSDRQSVRERERERERVRE
jgi:hypothetical protein